MTSHTPFNSAHKDRITAIATNHTHTRLLTASIDHRIAVYHTTRPFSTHPPTLLDLFTAHDAPIHDAKFLHTLTGCYLASIGADLTLRIFTEDVSQQLMSTRRFRRLTTIRSETFTPFVSLDTKALNDNATVYLAVIDRQGQLSLYEPTEPEQYKDWLLLHRFYVSGPASIPARGEPTSFRLCFDPNLLPLPYVTSCGDDRAQLGVFVIVNDRIKVYRSTTNHNHGARGTPITTTRADMLAQTTISQAAAPSLALVEVLTITPPTSSIHDNNNDGDPRPNQPFLKAIALAPLHHRDHDLLATASSNGSLSIYKITTTPRQSSNTRKPSVPDSQSPNHISPFSYTHTSVLLWTVPRAHGSSRSSSTSGVGVGLCAVKWHSDGQTLLSVGVDGRVRVWEKNSGSEDRWECTRTLNKGAVVTG